MMKELLLHLLQTATNKASWYAPLSAALDGLTETQARWRPAGADHSIAAITAHLEFYHQRELEKFQGIETNAFSGTNDDTFTEPATGNWPQLVANTFLTLSQWEQAVQSADDTKLSGAANLIGEIAAHLAYHTGQIVTLRKWQGSWNPDKGVK